MKFKVRKLCALVMALAAVCCSALAISVSVGAQEPAAEASAENRYVLRDYDGYVAVFIENQPDSPMTVTDIQVGTLRELDRELLETGLKVATHEKLMMTLEDICS